MHSPPTTKAYIILENMGSIRYNRNSMLTKRLSKITNAKKKGRFLINLKGDKVQEPQAEVVTNNFPTIKTLNMAEG